MFLSNHFQEIETKNMLTDKTIQRVRDLGFLSLGVKSVQNLKVDWK